MMTDEYIRKQQFTLTTKPPLDSAQSDVKRCAAGAIEAAETVTIGLLLCLEPPLLEGCKRPQPSVVNVDQRLMVLCSWLHLLNVSSTIAVSSGGSKRLHLRMD